MLYPLLFEPIFKERVWGGRRLEALYGKPLPPGVPIGESWEVSDRPGDESVVANGPLAGKTLRWLMERHGGDVLGASRAAPGHRFPLLCKILDARDILSLQVHPPAHRAAELGGEPKTEMWYITDASPGAELYAGLVRGATRDAFETSLQTGDVAEMVHRIPVRAGDTMFLPAGRLHAIGGGLVLFEIQQNSDTTYRVFDWNRMGLDGKPRELHIAQSLASIDFSDVEPSLVDAPFTGTGTPDVRPLVRHPLFSVDLCRGRASGRASISLPGIRIIASVSGRLIVEGNGVGVTIEPGRFCLVPASLSDVTVSFEADSTYLVVEA
jgi:mannose-6-phosphate isomerase